MVAETDGRTDERTGVDITSALERMTGIDKKMLITWPGRVEVQVGIQDARAARLLIDLMDEYDPLTCGEAEDILLAALWWLHFYSSSGIVEDPTAAPPPDEG